MADEEKLGRALAALDTMATVWAAKIDLRHAVKAFLRCPDAEDRIVAFIKHAHAEGLYEGRTSAQQEKPVTDEWLETTIELARDYGGTCFECGSYSGEVVAEYNALSERRAHEFGKLIAHLSLRAVPQGDGPATTVRPVPDGHYDLPDKQHGEFWCMAQGRADYVLSAFAIKSREYGEMLTIAATEEAVYITREQAKAFFGLVESDPALATPPDREALRLAKDALEDVRDIYGKAAIALAAINAALEAK